MSDLNSIMNRQIIISDDVATSLVELQQMIRENMSDAEKEFAKELEKSGLADAFVAQYIIKLKNPDAEQHYTKDKNSYGFWGPTSAKIVKSPETLWIPTSMEAFKATGLREIYTIYNEDTKPAIDESVDAAIAIENWAYQNKLNDFFLKNANFSGKHRWPLTCNIDYALLPEQSRDKRVAHTLRHMNNINSYAMLLSVSPGLGWVARKKLNLNPICYAFGTVVYTIKNRIDGTSKTFEYNGRQDVRDYMNELQKSNPNFELSSWKHIGMPITKEIRLFAIDGHVVGYVPYWTPIAFKNQSVYGVAENFDINNAIKELNTFSKQDTDHVRDETEKIMSHEKFHDINWTVDWVKNSDNDWYMIDMQTAETSYMDYDNMVFYNPSAKTTVNKFLVQRYQALKSMYSTFTPFQKLLGTVIRGEKMSVEKRLKDLGYPNAQRLQEMEKMIERTK